MPQGFSIAIDGPVASGKGTLASALSKEFKGVNINTGSMYRSVALLAIEKGLRLEEVSQVDQVLPEVNVEFSEGRTFLNGTDITERIKEPDTARGSSIVAQYESVREDLVRKQQKMAENAIKMGKVVIMEGRDIGTKVLPDASIKIFLTASPEIRAQRRLDQYKEQGVIKTFEEMLADVKERDARDTGREVDPLPSKPDEIGYFVIDDSGQTEEQTIDVVIKELKKRQLL